MEKETKLRRKQGFSGQNYFGEITYIVDRHMKEDFKLLERDHTSYVFAMPDRLKKEDVYPIRIPGRTIGYIKTDKESMIIAIKIECNFVVESDKEFNLLNGELAEFLNKKLSISNDYDE